MYRKISLFIILVLALVACSVGFRGHDALDRDEGEMPTLVFFEKPKEGEKLAKTVRWYRAYWGGLTVGDVFASLIPTKEGYGMKILIRTKGIAKMVSQWKADSGAIMREVEPGKFVATRFLTAYELRGKGRRIDIKRNEDGNITSEYNQPPENRAKRPAVPEDKKIGAVDPLTAVVVIRTKVEENIKNKIRSFTVPLYDGRRRSDLIFKIHGADKLGNVHVSFKEEPIAGYTQNELDDMGKENPSFHMYLSAKDLFPVAATGESIIGTATVRFQRECPSLEECVKLAE